MKNFNIESVAKKYIGQTEIKGNMGFTNQRFEDLMGQIGWKPSYQWCALFAELVWFEAFQGDDKMLKIIEKNFSASAVTTFKKFESIGMTSDKPVVGSVVIWQNHKNGQPLWTGHAGIVVKVDKDTFTSIEGNTNDAGGREGYIVAQKTRKYTQNPHRGLGVLGFINPNKDSSQPFKNKAEGNNFRKWVNDNHSEYAKQIDLDEKGSHTNAYILKAWNEYGKEYAKK